MRRRRTPSLPFLLGIAPVLAVLLLSTSATASSVAVTRSAPYVGGTTLVSSNSSSCGTGTVAKGSTMNLTTGNATDLVSGNASKKGDCAKATTESGVGITYVANRTTKLHRTAPSQRADSQMVYDAADGYVVLFGGCTVLYCGGVANDTWKFSGGGWTALSPAAHPSARSYGAMTYDARDGYVLLFGGTNLGSTSFSDTWKFSHGTWTNITPAKSPPGRYGAGMSYDAKDRYVVMFGGQTCWCSHTTILNDTWVFASGVWKNLSTVHAPAVREPARAMVYDEKDRYVVLFGGYIAGGWTLHDTWTFSGGVWKNITGTTYPSSRGAPGMAYDPTDGYVLVFGGYSPPYFDSDTWSFVHGVWHQISPNGSVPPSIANAVMAFDLHAGYAVLFSGIGAYGGPTWVYSGGTWAVPTRGTTVTVNWTLLWTARTQTHFVCLRYSYRGCLLYVTSTASIRATIEIQVTDITANTSHTQSFGSTTWFVSLSGTYTSKSPPGGLTPNAYATGSMQKNHTYEIETWISVQMVVSGATYTYRSSVTNLSAMASLDMASPYGGTLNGIAIA